MLPGYFLPRELFFDALPLPAPDERPLELLVLELFPLPVVLFDVALFLPVSLRGAPEDFG